VEAGVTSITWEGRPATMNFLSDITERKQAEEEIRAKSQFLERLIQQLPLPTFVLDDKGILLMANRAFLEYFAVPDEDMILGKSALTEPANVKHGVVKYIEEALGGKVVETPETEFLSPFNDKTTVVKSRLFPIFDPDGKLTNVVVMHEDITGRKEAEEALRESEANYRRLADSITDIFFAFDENMRYTYWNKASEELTGVPAKDAVGKSLYDLFPDTPQTRKAEGMYLDVLRTRQSQSFVSEYRFGGRDFIFEISAYPAKHGLSVFAKDISERKRMEEELVKAQKLESVGILAGGIAHDFNNILTAILGNISLARMYNNLEDKDKRLVDAERACIQARDLTQQLLTFSKGGAPIRKTASIAEMLRDSTIFTLRGSNVRCEFSIPDHLWPVEVDQGQMNQVINNIVINAGQAMPNGGIVRIRVENVTVGTDSCLPLEPGAYIKVSIADQGIGIPQEHLQRIFDPYFTTKQKGSGLGLAAAFSIVKKHDGHITVESEVGAGTTFHIYLPASSEAVLVVEREEEEKPITGEGKILVMDDEKHIRDLAANILSSIGYRVITAIDGAEAIELFKEAAASGDPFDAVILDLTIPGGMGGRETIQRLREIDSGVKAIVSSGYSDDPVLADFRKYGFKGVIAKPYEARHLSEILHRAITE
jgi:PAS domain S-box-containing protein